MNQVVKRIGTLLSVYYAYMLEYRAELVLWVLSGSLPLILMGVWNQAAQQGQFGLGPLQFVRYFLVAFMVRQITVVWVIWEFEKEVVQGQLSNYLLQPIDPVWRHVAEHTAERFARLPFVLMLLALFLLLYPQAAWVPQPGRLLLFAIAVVLVFALRFLIQYTFAMFSFWTERATAIEQFWFLIYLFLSGMIAPLDVFPEGLRAVVNWLPFPYLVYFPAALLTGLPVNVGQGFLAIALWGLFFWVLNRWLWRRGLKRYSGMGA